MWSAAILAGGQARRFGGRDKSALVVDGQSIRERQLAVLASVADDILIVGATITPVETIAGTRAVPDIVAGKGPLGGVYTALVEATGTATIVVACDMPFLTAPLLRHLLALTADADAVVPSTSRGYHPLCAAYTPACLAPIARRLSDGHLKMTDLLQDVRARLVTANDLEPFGDPERLLANLNTPAEYRALEASQP